jgi:uncharacterized protein YjbI with pentapeptide repeats
MKDADLKTQIRVLKDKVKYDFEHFEKYTESDEDLSVKSFRKIDTYNEFVTQNYIEIKKLIPNENDPRSGEISTQYDDILTHVISLLANCNKDTKKFIPITGEYGSGKSLLSFYILYKLCYNVKNDEVIPFYIPLGNLTNYDPSDSSTLIKSIFRYLSDEYNVTDQESFYRNVREGKITFILDALDEMSTFIEPLTVDKNIENIKSLSKSGNCIILTTRRTYLTKDQENNFINNHDLLMISDFDSKNIKEFVNKKINNGKIKTDKSIFLNDLENSSLKKFIKKPLFLEIICDKYDEIKNQSIVNPASIFRILTDEWIKHDVLKKHLNQEEKNKLITLRERISESMAFRSNKSRSEGAISLEDIKEQISEEFSLEKGYQVTDKQLNEFYKDAKDSTFLVRHSSEGSRDTFSFIQRSVMEYLLGRRIVNFINQNINESKTETILRYLKEIKSHETFEFIDHIVDIEWGIRSHIISVLCANLSQQKIEMIKMKQNRLDRIYELLNYAKNLSGNLNSEKNIQIGNLISILYSISDFAKFSFKNTTNNFTDENLNFSKCNLKGVRLPHANLSRSNFTNANLFKANLYGADLSYANLSGSTLYYADLSGANLSGANLTKG